MKRPSFQFYVGDWQSNSNLRRCTFAEKGIWLDVMCLMHDGEQYGVLRWPLKELAQAVGCKLADLKALATKGVLKGADIGGTCETYIYTPRSGGKDGESVTLIPTQPGPLWYSSRMVKDDHVSKSRGKGTRFGEDKEPTKPEGESQPTQRVGGNQSGSEVSAEQGAIEEKCDSSETTFQNRVNGTTDCNLTIDDPPNQRVGDGPSIFSLQSSTSVSKKETLDRAVPIDAAPPDPSLEIIRAFDDGRAHVFGEEVRRAFPAADDRVFAERFLEAGVKLDWLKSFFLERMAKRKKSGEDPPDGLKYFAKAVPEALQRIAAVKSAQAQVFQPRPEPIQRTPEEQAKYDAEQREWYLRNGIQHKDYNPEGLTVKGASA